MQEQKFSRILFYIRMMSKSQNHTFILLFIKVCCESKITKGTFYSLWFLISVEASHPTMLIILVSVFLIVLLCVVSIVRFKNNQKYADRHQPCPKVNKIILLIYARYSLVHIAIKIAQSYCLELCI